MDMFMDKLAQKLTAQEIINANTTAETEELNRLRNQIDEYDQCLAKLRLLLDESAEKLQGDSAAIDELSRLIEESMDKLNSCLQQNDAQNGELHQLLTDRLESMDKGLEGRLDEADRKLGERLGNMDRAMDDRLGSLKKVLEDRDGAFGGRLESVNRSLDERLGQLDSKLSEQVAVNLEDQLEQRLGAVSEGVHKECVKVYRNVQAVVVEESGKQTEALTGASDGVKRVGKKLNSVFGISIVALLFSLISVAIQILNLFNVKLF